MGWSSRRNPWSRSHYICLEMPPLSLLGPTFVDSALARVISCACVCSRAAPHPDPFAPTTGISTHSNYMPMHSCALKTSHQVSSGGLALPLALSSSSRASSASSAPTVDGSDSGLPGAAASLPTGQSAGLGLGYPAAAAAAALLLASSSDHLSIFSLASVFAFSRTAAILALSSSTRIIIASSAPTVELPHRAHALECLARGGSRQASARSRQASAKKVWLERQSRLDAQLYEWTAAQVFH